MMTPGLIATVGQTDTTRKSRSFGMKLLLLDNMEIIRSPD